MSVLLLNFYHVKFTTRNISIYRLAVEERLKLLENGIDELIASMSSSTVLKERLSAYREPDE